VAQTSQNGGRFARPKFPDGQPVDCFPTASFRLSHQSRCQEFQSLGCGIGILPMGLVHDGQAARAPCPSHKLKTEMGAGVRHGGRRQPQAIPRALDRAVRQGKSSEVQGKWGDMAAAGLMASDYAQGGKVPWPGNLPAYQCRGPSVGKAPDALRLRYRWRSSTAPAPSRSRATVDGSGMVTTRLSNSPPALKVRSP
jgi:hypothetical protein